MYLKVPRYALRDWLNTEEEYYAAFPPARVAITITPEGPSYPYILGTHKNPFHNYVGGGDNSDEIRSICMGTEWTKTEKNRLQGLPVPERCAKYLTDAAKILTKGYTTTGYGGMTRTLKVFPRVSKEFLEKEGIPITNIDGGPHERT